jgi:predicted metal-dependent hydrolase
VRANHQKIAALVERFKGGAFDAHYLGYFECFNRQLYFEAHEVLEYLWLEERGRPLDLFYKALIQLAGAFVHLQRNRRAPAIALFGLARRNFEQYPPYYEGLNLKALLDTINRYVEKLSSPDTSRALFTPEQAPKLFPVESPRSIEPAG